jgi:hypothetical protein
MPELSIEDKGKGKRIITQFFRTMPGVQKSLMSIFERSGYEGIYRLQNVLYPENSPEINSTDTLRKGLSMILQHIYGMPVEDKEGYFQEILKCKTPPQVVRKEKETLVDHFYEDFPTLKEYLLAEIIKDSDYSFITALCQKFIGEEEEVSDMRSFKNQIRNVREALADQIQGGTSEESLVNLIKEYRQELEQGREEQAQTAVSEAGLTGAEGEAGEKQHIIVNAFGDVKYKDLREFLLKKAVPDPNFATFQQYLDNILPSSSRLVTNDLQSFSEGVKKIKEFRDHLEKELLSSAS